MMPCRIGINVECCTVLHDQGLCIKGSMKEILTFHVMSDAFLIIVVGSTQVGSLSALVRHQEVEIWAEGEGVEEETRDLDDWEIAEIAERKAAKKAKIVAVPLAKFNTCFGHDLGQQNKHLFSDIVMVLLETTRLYLLYGPFAHMLRMFTLVIGVYL